MFWPAALAANVAASALSAPHHPDPLVITPCWNRPWLSNTNGDVPGAGIGIVESCVKLLTSWPVTSKNTLWPNDRSAGDVCTIYSSHAFSYSDRLYCSVKRTLSSALAHCRADEMPFLSRS